MMNYETWQMLSESLQGGMTLGLARPHTVGGLVGSNLHQEWDDEEDEDNEDDEFGDDEEYDGQQTKDRKEGDLVGSTHPDDGPDKGFPPDSQEDEDGLPTPDEELGGADDFDDMEGDDDFLASLGAGAGGEEGLEDGGDFGGEDDFLSSLGGMGGEGPGGDPVGGGQGEDMDFLNDIDPSMAGFGDDEGGMGGGDLGGLGGDDLGGDDLGGLGGDDLGGMGGDEFGGDEFGGEGDPCPDCNAGGEFGDGEEGCPTCGGEGFLGGEGGDLGGDLGGMGGDEFGGDEFGDYSQGFDDPEAAEHDHMNSFMKKMASYMKKHMKKEWASFREFAPAMAAAAPPAAGGGMGAAMGRAATNPMMQQMAGQAAQGAGAQVANNMMQPPPQQNNQQQQQQQQQQNPQMMRRKMVKFMTKDGKERKFMAADAPRSYMKKHMKKETVQNESFDFLSSLKTQAQGTNYKKNWNGISEDAIFNLAGPDAEYAKGEPKPGDVGYAPSGRVGGIGGGYTKQDFADLPTLGESRRYPTLSQYAAYKARQKANRRGR